MNGTEAEAPSESQWTQTSLAQMLQRRAKTAQSTRSFAEGGKGIPKENAEEESDDSEDEFAGEVVPWTEEEIRDSLGTFLEKISKSCRSQFELENSVVSAGDQWLGKDHFEAFSMLGTGEDEAALSQLIWSRFKRKVLALQAITLEDDFFVFNPTTPPAQPTRIQQEEPENPSLPIVDVRVIRDVKRKGGVPEGYTVLRRSFRNSDANLNKGTGGKSVYLCYKRLSKSDGPDVLPITSVLVCVANASGSLHEELPYGYELVKTSVEGQLANLNGDTGGHPFFLCLRRGGDTPPITDLKVLYRYGTDWTRGGRDTFRKVKGLPPVDYLEVCLTPSLKEANVNAGSEGPPIFLCFQPRIEVALTPFKRYIADLSARTQKCKNTEEGKELSVLRLTTEEGFAKTLSTLVSCFYCHNQHIVTHALGCFSRLSKEYLPPPLLNLFVQALCDAVPTLLAYCSAATRSFLLEQLLQFTTSFNNILSLETTMKIMEAIFVNFKPDEEGPKVGEKMIEHLMKSVSSSSSTPTVQAQSSSSPSPTFATPSVEIAYSSVMQCVENATVSKKSEQALSKFHSERIARGNLRSNTRAILRAIDLDVADKKGIFLFSESSSPVGSLSFHSLTPSDVASIKDKAEAVLLKMKQRKTSQEDKESESLTRMRPASLAALSASSSAFPSQSDKASDQPKPKDRVGQFFVNQLGGFSAAKMSINLDFKSGTFILAKVKIVKGVAKVSSESAKVFQRSSLLKIDKPRQADVCFLAFGAPKPFKASFRFPDNKIRDEFFGLMCKGFDLSLHGSSLRSLTALGRRRHSRSVSAREAFSPKKESSQKEEAKEEEGATEGATVTTPDGAVVAKTDGAVVQEKGPTGAVASQEAFAEEPVGSEELSTVDGKVQQASVEDNKEEKEEKGVAEALDGEAAKSPAEILIDSVKHTEAVFTVSQFLHLPDAPFYGGRLRASSDARVEAKLAAITLMCCKVAMLTDKESRGAGRTQETMMMEVAKIESHGMDRDGGEARGGAGGGLRDASESRGDGGQVKGMTLQEYALRLLLYVVSRGAEEVSADKSGGGSGRQKMLLQRPCFLFITRRFIFPALAACSLSPVKIIFDLTLKVYAILWKKMLKYKLPIAAEIGVFMDLITRGHLDLSSADRKLAILDIISSTFLVSPSSIIDIFYSYDANVRTPPVFMHLVEACVKVGSSQVVKEWHKGGSSGDDEMQQGHGPLLRHYSLSFTVHTLNLLQTWSSNTRGASAAAAAAASDAVTSSGPSAASTRRGSWYGRLTDRLRVANLDMRTLQVQQQKQKLKHTVRYFLANSPHKGGLLIHALSSFLFRNTHKEPSALDKAEVGDMLSGLDDGLITAKQYCLLRASYVSHMDFTGLTFDEAIREYLCEGGFRLPGEAQKIDRLLESFCVGYCKQNPDTFRSSGSAFVVAFALIMLNTDLHDGRLKSGSRPRKPMSVEQFMNNLRGVDEGNDFPADMLRRLYSNIKENPIQWKESQAEDPSNPSEDKGSNLDGRDDNNKKLQSLYKRAQMKLRNPLSEARCFGAAPSEDSLEIVCHIFQASWYHFYKALTVGLHTIDLPTLDLCLEGAEHAEAFCDRMQLPEQMECVGLLARLRHRLKLLRLKAGIHAAQLPKPLLSDHRVRLKHIPRCVPGSALVDWFIVNAHAEDREAAVVLGQQLFETGFTSTQGDVEFKDGKDLYHFKAVVLEKRADKKSPQRGTVRRSPKKEEKASPKKSKKSPKSTGSFLDGLKPPSQAAGQTEGSPKLPETQQIDTTLDRVDEAQDAEPAEDTVEEDTITDNPEALAAATSEIDPVKTVPEAVAEETEEPAAEPEEPTLQTEDVINTSVAKGEVTDVSEPDANEDQAGTQAEDKDYAEAAETGNGGFEAAEDEDWANFASES